MLAILKHTTTGYTTNEPTNKSTMYPDSKCNEITGAHSKCVRDRVIEHLLIQVQSEQNGDMLEHLRALSSYLQPACDPA